MLKLFASLRNYFCWFNISEDRLSVSAIIPLLPVDVEKCAWVDALGMRILLRRNAFGEAKTHIESVNDSELNDRNKRLKKLLIDIINGTETDLSMIERFVLPDDDGEEKDWPIPMFSSITPHHAVRLILHVMLVCREYETELNIHNQPTMRDILVAFFVKECKSSNT